MNILAHKTMKQAGSTILHGVDQAINRNVSPKSIREALNSPLKVNPIKTDSLGRPSQRYIGAQAEVVINPSTKRIISVNPTSTEKAARLAKELASE